jgi:outer membrane protein insertion porin family
LRKEILTLFFLLTASALASEALIESVTVPGTSLEVKLATQAGHPYNAATIQQDVRYLWSLGRFEDIRVETAPAGEGLAVVFHAIPRPVETLHEIRIVPNTYGIQVNLPEGTRIDRERAQQIALDAQRQLQDRGYQNARVTYDFSPAVQHEVDLKLTVDPGDEVRVRGVEFTGELGIAPKQLRHELRALKPTRILPGWRLLPSFSQGAVDADAARLRSYYFFNGYFDVDIRAPLVQRDGKDARVVFSIDAGPKHPAPDGLCGRLSAERRESERRGILDFTASADVDSEGQLHENVELGEPYTVGRIQFIGHPSYTDGFLRGQFVLDEGQPFDDRQLRRSLSRINRTGLFEPIDDTSIAIMRNPETHTANVSIRLRERKRGAWNLSGPVGPMSLAGPLQASISSHLPPWGRGMLELSTYTASFSVFAFARPLIPVLGFPGHKRLFPVLAIQRPFTPGGGWLSGFAIAPQLGWQALAGGYLATQIEQRLLPKLQGERGITPSLPVTVHRASGDMVIACEPTAPKLAPLRVAAGFALNALGAMTTF